MRDVVASPTLGTTLRALPHTAHLTTKRVVSSSADKCGPRRVVKRGMGLGVSLARGKEAKYIGKWSKSLEICWWTVSRDPEEIPRTEDEDWN